MQQELSEIETEISLKVELILNLTLRVVKTAELLKGRTLNVTTKELNLTYQDFVQRIMTQFAHFSFHSMLLSMMIYIQIHKQKRRLKFYPQGTIKFSVSREIPRIFLDPIEIALQRRIEKEEKSRQKYTCHILHSDGDFQGKVLRTQKILHT